MEELKAKHKRALSVLETEVEHVRIKHELLVGALAQLKLDQQEEVDALEAKLARALIPGLNLLHNEQHIDKKVHSLPNLMLQAIFELTCHSRALQSP